MMSDARRRPATEPLARAKPLPRSNEPWRLEIERWSAEDRFVWEERVAIMIVDGGLSEDEAERLAFEDASRYRAARR